jgi:hypothetical protein
MKCTIALLMAATAFASPIARSPKSIRSQLAQIDFEM